MEVPIELKVCRKCHFEKPIARFSVTDKATGARRARCNTCEAARVRAVYAESPKYRAKTKANSVKWAIANPEKAAVHRRKASITYAYGITTEQYAALLTAQDNRCALCGATEHGHKHRNGKAARLPGGRSTNWPIDHCHKTDRVRGLLCHACNTQLGGYETLLAKVGEAMLLEYLTRHSPVPPSVITPAPALRFVAELPVKLKTGDSRCCVEGCDWRAQKKRMCGMHHARTRLTGNPGPAGALPHAGSSLTEDDIRAIRASTETGMIVAKRYGISQGTVSLIRSRETWRHVE